MELRCLDVVLARMKPEYYVIAALPLMGLFPVITNQGVQHFPPIFFAALSALIGGLFMFFPGIWIRLRTKQAIEISRKEWGYIMGNTFLNIVIPYILIFVGTRYTSSINTTLLHQTELLTAVIVNGIIFNEAVSRGVYAGGMVVFAGTLLVLFNGSFNLNYGDFLIILATFFYPFGNIYGKKSVQTQPPWLVLLLRNIVGGLVLLIVSLLFEYIPPTILVLMREYIWLLLFNGIFITSVSKWLWLIGLRDLSIVKGTIFVICGAPIGILFSIFLAHEIPTAYQIGGSILMIGGLWYLTMQNKQTKTLAADIR